MPKPESKFGGPHINLLHRTIGGGGRRGECGATAFIKVQTRQVLLLLLLLLLSSLPVYSTRSGGSGQGKTLAGRAARIE